jgi:hypothetical protein
MQKFLRIFFVVALLAIVGYGLRIAGSPAHTRAVNEDIETLEELEELHGALDAYRHRNGNSLEELNSKALNGIERGSYGQNQCSRYYNGREYDEERLKRYEYTAKTDGYKICTTLNTSWADVKLNQRLYGDRFLWARDFNQGRNCFERSFTPCKQRNQP